VGREDANAFLASLSAEQLAHLDKLMGFKLDEDAERESDRAALRRAGIVVLPNKKGRP
jgi:hypothetical protein